MGIEQGDFKEIMSRWASGVTIVTSRHGQEPVGMTVSSFASVCLQPAQVLICVNHTARAHDAIEQSGYFAVNILGMEQKEWGMRFAGLQPEVTDRFQGIEWIEAQTGAPILPGVLGWLDCQLRHRLASGDHTIFVGEVAACEVGEGGMPLLYYSRDWRHLAEYAVNPALPEKRGVISTDGVARTVVAVQNSAGDNSEDH